MSLFRKGSLCLAGLSILVALTGEAQELRGRITGTVKDNTGAVLPGVSVTATSPALMQPQTTLSREDGAYQFPALPSGAYALTFELAGFQTVKREGIRVLLNTTLTVDTALAVAAVAETITITGESPVVDVKTTSIGTSFTKELLTDIPNSRDVWAIMSQAPGFQMTGYDVGGSHTGTQTGYHVYGFSDQHKTLLEGINVTEGTAANAGYFDFGSFEEFQLGGAGNLGEQSGPGALLNVTTKSGGDEFHGTVYFDYESEGTITDNVPDDLKAAGAVGSGGFRAPSIRNPETGQLEGLRAGNPITKQYDFNVGVGGPIVRGKLWFYLGYRDNNQYKTILGLPGEDAQSQLINYTAKLNYQINPRNQLIAFFNQRTKLQPLRDLSLAIPLQASYYQSSKNIPVKLEWTSTVSDRVFLNLQAAFWGNYFPLYHQDTRSRSVDGVDPGRIELTTSQFTGAQDYYHDRITEKPQASGSVSYYKDDWLGGDHSFKFGFEAYRERRTFHRFQPGNVFYRDRSGVPVEVDIYNTPNAGINDTRLLAVYAQDTFALTPRFTLNLGARFDHYNLGWPEQSFTPAQTQYFQAVNTPATTLVTLGSLSPRIGFAWDVTGKGKTVVKAFFGRYYYNPSTDIGTRENPVGQAARRFQFRDQNGNRLLDGPQELGNQISTLGGAGFVNVDRNLKHAYGQELSTHMEHELMAGLSVRGSYVYKAFRNGWDEVDLGRVNEFTVPFNFVDVGPDNIRGTGDDRTLSLFDLRPGTTPNRVYTNPGSVPGLADYAGDYHTAEFAIHRRMRNRWMLLTSFEHTWAKDFRGVASSTSSLGVARQALAYLWRPMERRFDPQPTSFWNYKLLGRYEFPWAFSLAASYKLQSGYNWARTVSVPFPVAGNRTIPAEPVNANRAPDVHILDFRGEKSFGLGGRRGKIALMVDVFNALNSDVVTNFRVITGTRFQEVIALLDPRIVRFGVRYEF